MTIEIEINDITAPNASTEDKTTAIEVGMAYSRLIAPCVDTLEGDGKVFAKALIIKGIEHSLNAVEINGVVRVGPFTMEGEVNESYFPSKIVRQLQSLCGIKQGFSTLRLNRGSTVGLFGPNAHFVSNIEWSE